MHRRIGVAALGIHLLLVVLIALQDFSSTLASSPNLLPDSFLPCLRRLSAFTTALTNRSLTGSTPLGQIIAGYTDATGIESGYSYFAPNVPGNTKLAFELYFPDGHLEYDVPAVTGVAAGYRVSTLLDHLHAVTYVRLREALLTDLVTAVREEHPEAVKIRAVFGAADLTSVQEYRAGKRNSYHVLYAYDFRARPRPKTLLQP